MTPINWSCSDPVSAHSPGCICMLAKHPTTGVQYCTFIQRLIWLPTIIWCSCYFVDVLDFRLVIDLNVTNEILKNVDRCFPQSKPMFANVLLLLNTEIIHLLSWRTADISEYFLLRGWKFRGFGQFESETMSFLWVELDYASLKPCRTVTLLSTSLVPWMHIHAIKLLPTCPLICFSWVW